MEPQIAQISRNCIDKDYEFCGIREKKRLGPCPPNKAGRGKLLHAGIKNFLSTFLWAGLGEIEKMDEIGQVKVIRYNFGPKILVIFLVGLVVTVTTVLFYVGNTAGRISGGIGILFIIWLGFKTRHHMRVFLVPFKPAFIIYTEGIKFDDLFVEWEQIKEIVVFNFEGRKHFGFRLKDDLTTLQGRDINECMKGNFDWSVFKMPFATMYKALSTPASDIIEMLHSQYGLKVRYKEEDVGIGNENEI